MKKRALAAFAVAIPLALTLCACGGGTPSTPLNANWYKSGEGGNIGGKSEALEYKVTFEPANSTVPVSYSEGTYKTSLEAVNIKISDDATVYGYHLHSELTISPTFTLNGDSKTFEDSVVSDVYFHPLSPNRLQPVRSTKYVKCAAPLANAKKLEDAYKEYEYTYSVEYTETLSKAAISYVQTKPETTETTRTVSVKSKSLFYDNEQLLFVLRGLSMDSVASFKTINPLDFSETSVTMSEKPTETTLTDFTFNLNGEPVTEQFSAYKLAIRYTGSFSGQMQKLMYAANTKSSKGENIYRNVLLEMSVPVLNNFGSLNYQLKSAAFIGD